MAINQLKGAAGVEFITRDLSTYNTNDDTSFKVGLVGWTSQGPANQVVSITSTNQLYSVFGTPTKLAKNNQLLYAAKLLLDTGATLKVVRMTDTEEKLNAVAVKFNTVNTSILNYDTVLSGGVSGTFSGTNSYTGDYTRYNESTAPLGFVATSNTITEVVNKVDPITLTPSTIPESPFTLATKYPGFTGYSVTVQTYANYTTVNELTATGSLRLANSDTFTSRSITEDIEFTSYVTGEGIYDALRDRFFPADTGFYTNDDDIEVPVVGVFKRYNEDLAIWETNEALTEFIHIFGIIRVYAGTSSTPIQTLPFTRVNYVTGSDVQLKLDETTKSGSLLIGVVNENFSGVWLGRTPYIITKTALTGAKAQTVPYKVALKDGNTSPLATATPQYDLAWGLFKNLSTVKVNLLCAAGTTVSGFGSKFEEGETIARDIIVSMLEVCTIRKDCIAIFDLPKRKDCYKLIEETEQYVPGIGLESGGSNATFESFWGAMYDGRQMMFDKFNKKDVEVAMTSFVAQNICNVWTNQYPWYIVAGSSRGTIGYPSNGMVTPRYYPDEVGALYTDRINTTRNLDGQFIWGEATLQKKNSSLNRLHASSLLAYLYGRLRTLLTPYVYELNTPDLRKTIRSEVLAVIQYIKDHDGVYNLYVQCDDNNNTSDIIDNQQLIVDIGIEISKGAERITVRNSLYRTNGLIEAGLV